MAYITNLTTNIGGYSWNTTCGTYTTTGYTSLGSSSLLYGSPSYGFSRKEEQDDGIRYVYFLPGCNRDNVAVTYVPQENRFTVKANDDKNVKDYTDNITVSPKYDVSGIVVFIKNGVAAIELPIKKEFLPKTARIL